MTHTRPHLLGLALALAVVFSPTAARVRAQDLDGKREQHETEPVYRGTTANAPIPAALHTRNEGGSDGAGLCVISSLRINGRYQKVPNIESVWEAAKLLPGGYSPDNLETLLERVLPEEKWASYVGRDDAIMAQLSALGYPVGATMNTGELYGYQPIHHMISLVHYDPAHGLACVVDNNQPGIFTWMNSAEFGRRWVDGGEGWAFVWTRKLSVLAGIPWYLIGGFAVAVAIVFLASRPRPSPAPALGPYFDPGFAEYAYP